VADRGEGTGKGEGEDSWNGKRKEGEGGIHVSGKLHAYVQIAEQPVALAAEARPAPKKSHSRAGMLVARYQACKGGALPQGALLRVLCHPWVHGLPGLQL